MNDRNATEPTHSTIQLTFNKIHVMFVCGGWSTQNVSIYTPSVIVKINVKTLPDDFAPFLIYPGGLK